MRCGSLNKRIFAIAWVSTSLIWEYTFLSESQARKDHRKVRSSQKAIISHGSQEQLWKSGTVEEARNSVEQSRKQEQLRKRKTIKEARNN
jgi:hypothetical protein